VSINGLNGYDGFNGVPSHQTLAYLGPNNEKLCYVLDNLSNNSVMTQLRNTFATYQKSGVNLIRVPIHPGLDMGCQTQEYGDSLYNGGFFDYSIPADTLLRYNRIQQYKSLLDTANNYGLKVELIFETVANSDGLYRDTIGTPGNQFRHEKKWIDAWMRGLGFAGTSGLGSSNVVLICVTFELFIHSQSVKGDGSYWLYPNVPAGDTFSIVSNNHGKYITDVWHWFHNKYPSVPGTAEFWTEKWNASYSTLPGMQYSADSALISATANWIGDSIPGMAYASIETYFYLPVSSAYLSDYLSTEKNLLSAYFSSSFYLSSQTPLWVDEYGHLVCNSPGTTCPSVEANQSNYYYGVLNATEQYPGSKLAGRVSWVGTNDSLYDNDQRFGLFTGFDASNAPIVRPAWKHLTSFYLGNPLAVPSGILPLLGQ
jgi:hypothetical protein